jgi:hypothetical protein
MISLTEELIQAPDAPNLYWAVTALPSPFLDLRRPMWGEIALMSRTLPSLRSTDPADMTPQQAQALADEAVKAMAQICGEQMPSLAQKLAVAALVEQSYPEAKSFLLAQGHKAEAVETMSHAQVVALRFQQQLGQMRDDLLKWIYVPYWQGHAGMEEAEKRIREVKKPESVECALFGLAVPAISKVYSAHARTERQIAGLRCAEAIRLYAATHDGKLPQALADIKEVPLPVDPFTGKGLDAWYAVAAEPGGDRAVLEVPPPPGISALAGRRYEFARSSKK